MDKSHPTRKVDSAAARRIRTPDSAALGRIRTLPSLARRIISCEACPRLAAHRRLVAEEKRRAYRDSVYWGKPVPGFGDPAARVVLIGLAPGAHGANRTGRMFTGDSSANFLFAALHRSGFANQPASTSADDGLELRDCYITNAVRCVPPGNRPSPEERRSCRPYLFRELALLPRLRVLFALGQVAYEECLRSLEEWAGPTQPRVGAGNSPNRAPKFAHGLHWAHPSGLLVCASYHPSQQNTQTGRLTAAMFDAVLLGVRANLETRPHGKLPAGARRSTCSSP